MKKKVKILIYYYLKRDKDYFTRLSESIIHLLVINIDTKRYQFFLLILYFYLLGLVLKEKCYEYDLITYNDNYDNNDELVLNAIYVLR